MAAQGPRPFAKCWCARRKITPRPASWLKVHPETQLGLRPGHYGPETAAGRISLLADPVAPQTLLEGAIAVYTATSQLGFEAVLVGHRPHVFGTPFYAGWGLTEDEQVFPRRRRTLTRVQLFAAAMILAPVWYDPCRDRLCSFEEAVDQLEATVRAWREDRHGYVAIGMRLWKRRPLAAMLGRPGGIRFTDDPARATRLARGTGRRMIGWRAASPRRQWPGRAGGGRLSALTRVGGRAGAAAVAGDRRLRDLL